LSDVRWLNALTYVVPVMKTNNKFDWAGWVGVGVKATQLALVYWVGRSVRYGRYRTVIPCVIVMSQASIVVSTPKAV